MVDIVIIGAGVSGCAIAREVSRYKADVLVLEREEDVCCGTSKANSAIVHAGYDAAHGSLMAKLNVEGSRIMPGLAQELDFAFENNGSLVVMMSEEDRPALNKLYENGVANGVEGLRIIERDELVAMEPNISDEAVAALYAPTGGIVCPFGLTSLSNWNFTPLWAAFSARAKVSPKGHTIPPVGAYSAATASSLMFGSISTSSSRSTMRRPSTPLATPLAYSLFRAGRSSSLIMTTREPFCS